MTTKSFMRRLRLGLCLAAVVFAAACSPKGEVAPDAPDADVTAEPVRLDHIPSNPRGGRWMAPSTSQANFVRRFDASGELILVGVPLDRAIAIAYQVRPGDVVVPQGVQFQAFDAIVKPPPGEAERASAMLRDMMREEFGFVAARRRVATRTMVLGPAPGAVPLAPSRSKEGFLELQQGRLTARGVTMAQLIALLERDTERPIVDESRLAKTYDFVLQWDPSKGAYAFLQALGDIGLQLEAGVRKVDRYFVASTGPARASDGAAGTRDARRAKQETE